MGDGGRAGGFIRVTRLGNTLNFRATGAAGWAFLGPNGHTALMTRVGPSMRYPDVPGGHQWTAVGLLESWSPHGNDIGGGIRRARTRRRV